MTNSQSKLITTYHDIVRATIITVATNTPAESPVKKPTTKFGSPDTCMTVIDVVSIERTSEVKIAMQSCLVIALSGVGHCLFNLTVLP